MHNVIGTILYKAYVCSMCAVAMRTLRLDADERGSYVVKNNFYTLCLTNVFMSFLISIYYVPRKRILTGKWDLFRSCVISLSEVVWAGMRVWEDSKCMTASLYSYILRYRSSSVCNRVRCDAA